MLFMSIFSCLATSLFLSTFSDAQFVTTNGLHFELKGKPYSFAGTNAWTRKKYQATTSKLYSLLSQLVQQTKASSLMPLKLPRR